ncbi:MAG: hypothetical protein WCA35_31980 [Kovacikia sp.]
MTLDWFYKLTDWNPQFFREFKGRLKPRNLGVTITTSLLLQLSIVSYFWMALPGNSYTSPNRYCTGPIEYSEHHQCINDALGNMIINWQRWWFDLFQVLSWGMPFIMLIAGVYMLIGDLGKEEHKGTLNFIRLTPQSSQSILLGKILGVPAIPYLLVGLAIPLHLIAAAGSERVSVQEVLSIYVLTGVVASCYFTGALLFAFLGGLQGWLGAIVVWFSFTMCFQFWQMLTYRNALYPVPDYYWGLPIANRLGFALAFAVATFGTATYWFWQAVNRRFRNPNATLLSKRQSYWMTTCFEVWLCGFIFRQLDYPGQRLEDFAVIALINLLWFVLLMAALMPQRQMLLDWARYRRERVSSAKKFWSQSIIKELVFGEKSPALLAIALNLLIPVAILMPWIVTWNNTENQLQACATMLLGISFVLICAAIAQIILFSKAPKRGLWASGAVGALIFMPPLVLGVLSFSPSQVPIAWLFSAFALLALTHTSMTTVFASFLAHLGILALLTTRLTRQLRKAGESETKALLASAKG